MARLRSFWIRSYPTVVFYWIVFVNRALALDVSAVDKQGQPPPEGALHETYQGITLSIHDQVAALRGSYHFKNDHAEALELTCRFRLGQRELVDGFAYYNGAEKIVGEVLEKQAATEVYEQLADIGRDPGILEQEGEQFRFRVFPVEPKEEKPVELSTVAPLAMHEGWIEYVLPRENLPQGKAVFSLHATITDHLPIAEMQLRGFAGKVDRRSSHEVQVVYESDSAALTQDLVIRYRLAADDYGLRLVTHRDPGGDGEGSFMLIVSPKAAVAEQDVIGRDIVFVTDISGSMSGLPMLQSKQGLEQILKQLSAKDRFEVISFDDEHYATFGHLVEASSSNLLQAATAVQKLETRGGTNIQGALDAALETLKSEQHGRPRAIVFLTDGQGDAPPEVVLASVREHAGSVRIYSFGVGTGVNRSFLQRLADDNRGTATFVQDGAQIASEMQGLYARIAMPLMLNLQLDFGGLPITATYPKQLPDLYRDGEVVVLGRYKPGHGKIKLRGELSEGAKEIALDASFPESEPEHAYVEKLWAQKRIETLLSTLDLRGQAPE
ncbi:MAG TPA: VWA domain-containing protein, partial [Polyangiales bacterium]|nr:VWA domain-containing protein [Polyangiales bacterium]